MEMGELIMIEIERNEYDELLEMATKLGIIRRMVNDEDEEHRSKGYSGTIETKVLRQVLGMAPWETDNA